MKTIQIEGRLNSALFWDNFGSALSKYYQFCDKDSKCWENKGLALQLYLIQSESNINIKIVSQLRQHIDGRDLSLIFLGVHWLAIII